MATSRLCSIPGCDKPHKANGLCRPHYLRMWRSGDVGADQPVVTTTRRVGDEVCSIDGCGKPLRSRGWCFMHWKRWRRHGDPVAGRTLNGEAKRYIRDVVLAYSGDECLAWPYLRNPKGYALLCSGKLAHRFVCAEANGPPPTPEHHALHSCGKGHLACVAPGHLRWGTRTENMADKVIHGTAPRGERGANARLTIDQVRQIRALRGKLMQRDIAQQFNVSSSAISMVQTRKRWAYNE